MKTSLFLLVFAGYFLSFVLYFMSFELQKESISHWARRIVSLSLLTHLVFLLTASFKAGHFAVNNLSEYIQMVSFLILCVSFVVETRTNVKFLMLFSLPIVLIFCLFGILLAEQKAVMISAQRSGWLWLHTGFILAGFSSLIIAVSSALMYLLQSSQLKSKHLGKVFLKLPSLNTLDQLHFVTLAWGVILFSLGMLIGLLWARTTQEFKEILKDPTVLLSSVTCLMYWVVLSFRFSAIRRGHKIAAGTVLVFALLFLTLMTSNYAPTGFHRGF